MLGIGAGVIARLEKKGVVKPVRKLGRLGYMYTLEDVEKIKDYVANRPYKWWSAEEDEVIKRYYSSLGREELLKLLPGRTWEAIKDRAFKFGIARSYTSRYPLRRYALSDFQKGHLAALIDGEGTVSLTFNSKRGQIIPIITVTNKDRKLLEFARNCINDGYIANDRRGGVLRWTLLGIRKVYPLLKQIEPYLIVKRERARLVLKWCESRMAKPYPCAPYTKEEWEIYDQIRKRKGERK